MAHWIGIGRRARRCYGFDDVALVPGTATVNPNEVDASLTLCAGTLAFFISLTLFAINFSLTGFK